MTTTAATTIPRWDHISPKEFVQIYRQEELKREPLYVLYSKLSTALVNRNCDCYWELPCVHFDKITLARFFEFVRRYITKEEKNDVLNLLAKPGTLQGRTAIFLVKQRIIAQYNRVANAIYHKRFCNDFPLQLQGLPKVLVVHMLLLEAMFVIKYQRFILKYSFSYYIRKRLAHVSYLFHEKSQMPRSTTSLRLPLRLILDDLTDWNNLDYSLIIKKYLLPESYEDEDYKNYKYLDNHYCYEHNNCYKYCYFILFDQKDEDEDDEEEEDEDYKAFVRAVIIIDN